MTIQYKRGDLFSTNIKTLVHGCNAQGVMGSGIAAAIRKLYPEAYQHYKAMYNSATDKHASSLPLGAIYPAHSRGKLIINAITQRYYGRDNCRYCSYDAIDDAMLSINTLCARDSIENIAMPKIGAGLGGGHWPIIESIINHRITAAQCTVYEL